MAEKDLYRSYFYTDEGVKDELAFGIHSCTDQTAYLVLKNNFDNRADLVDLFLDDLTVCIDQDFSGGINNIWLHTMGLYKEVYSLNEIPETNSDAYEKMEQLLSGGLNIFVRTFFPAFKFSRHYNPKEKPEDFSPSHGFLVIWQDKDNIYYVEFPELLEYKHYIPFAENSEVGVLKKKEFREVASTCLKCYTFKIYEDKLGRLKENFENAISQSIENYNDKYFVREDSVVSCGREAILRFMEICEKESLRLDAKVSPNQNFLQYFEIKIASVIKRRKLMLLSMESTAKFENKAFYPYLYKAFKDVIHAWTECSQNLSRQYFKERFVLDRDTKEDFTNILKKEDTLNHYLKWFMEEIA